MESALVGQDSDFDRLLDEEEINLGTDPNDPDSDNDGLGDWDEFQVYGTDPLDPDTDGDTMPDGVEVFELNTLPICRPGDARHQCLL